MSVVKSWWVWLGLIITIVWTGLEAVHYVLGIHYGFRPTTTSSGWSEFDWLKPFLPMSVLWGVHTAGCLIARVLGR